MGEVRIHDPYKWLEASSEETEAFTTAQEKYTRDILDANPDRDNLEEEIRNNTNYAKVFRPTSSTKTCH